MLLFVYGTLKLGGRLHHHMKGATFVCDDVVTNCNLYMLDWYPAVTKGLLEVQGQVYEIDDRLLRIMDQVEGEGTLYKREQRKTKNGHSVWMYFYLGDVRRDQLVENGFFDVSWSETGRPEL